MSVAQGFPPIARPDARILILGSLPGDRSIRDQQYYAHPQNTFWKIMRDLFGISGDYASRCTQLINQRVALWDVLYSSIRPGSLDADIRVRSASANDFKTFLEEHEGIELIAFNGKKAQQLFERFVDVPDMCAQIRKVGLPSTSPAYASMPFSGKLAAWQAALSSLDDRV